MYKYLFLKPNNNRCRQVVNIFLFLKVGLVKEYS